MKKQIVIAFLCGMLSLPVGYVVLKVSAYQVKDRCDQTIIVDWKNDVNEMHKHPVILGVCDAALTVVYFGESTW